MNKRIISILLCAILILPMFRPVALAFAPDIPLPEGVWDYILQDKNETTVSRPELERILTDWAGVDLHFNGGQALYTQYGSNHIQIGDYTFDKYVPETIVGGSDWDEMMSLYFGLNHKDSLTYIIPFFIYQNELYFQWGSGLSTEWKITDGSVEVKMFSYYFNYWMRMLGQRYACSYTSSSNLNGMEFYLTRDLGNFTYSYHWSSQVTTSTNHWLNVSGVVRQKPSNYQTITNNVKTFPNIVSNGSVSDVSAFGESGAFGFFYVPPEFYAQTNKTLHDYILTLTAENLYHIPPPLELIMTVKLPTALETILDELGDDDTVTIVRDPATNDITYNITVNNYNNSTFDFKEIVAAILAQPKILIDLLGVLLKTLFIPNENFFDSIIQDLIDALFTKLPILEQIITLFNNFIDQLRGASAEPPVFEIELWGSRVSIFDTAFFGQFRPLIHGIIIVIAYYFFIRRLLRRIPKALGGVEK